jgi:hypothetical protein
MSRARLTFAALGFAAVLVGCTSPQGGSASNSSVNSTKISVSTRVPTVPASAVKFQTQVFTDLGWEGSFPVVPGGDPVSVTSGCGQSCIFDSDSATNVSSMVMPYHGGYCLHVSSVSGAACSGWPAEFTYEVDSYGEPAGFRSLPLKVLAVLAFRCSEPTPTRLAGLPAVECIPYESPAAFYIFQAHYRLYAVSVPRVSPFASRFLKSIRTFRPNGPPAPIRVPCCPSSNTNRSSTNITSN